MSNCAIFTIPQIEKYKKYIPVLIDDIIVNGNAIIETISYLKRAGMKPPVCIGIHAVFDEMTNGNLLEARVDKVVTCNTITHPSDAIYVDELLAREIYEISFIC